jgi:hypothetical protein
MRRFFKFWWLCVRVALKGNSAFANSWQWLLGVPIFSLFALWLGRKLGVPEFSTGNATWDAFLAASGAFVVTWLVAFGVRFLNAPVILYHEEKKKAELVADRIEILFPERCNSPAVDSPYRLSWSPLCSEGGAAQRISFHRCFLGVGNPSNGKTLRNVRLVMETLSLGPGQILNMPCVCERTQTEGVDIPPGAEEFFLIGEGIDDSDAGIFRPRFLTRVDYEAAIARTKNDNTRFRIISGARAVPLLRNDGYRVEITAYADDTSPVKKVLIIDAKNQIALRLQERNA